MKEIVSERKIKHWQGYGSVDARVLKKTNDTLVVRVSGNHEYGLDCDKYDTYLIYDWLVKRFCPNKTERDIESVDIDDRYEQIGNLDVEVCDYTIHFKEGHMWQESSEDTLKDIERGYGPKVAQALLKYCAIKKLDIDDVVSDMSEDGNGMTAWDKFDLWAQKVQKLDIMGNFDDTYDWTGSEERARQEKEREQELADGEKELREVKRNQKELTKLRKGLKGKKRKAKKFGRTYQAPSDFSNMDESSGSRMEENDILDWIYQEMGECEWAGEMDFLDNENAFEVSIPRPDGDVFKVSVTKVWSGRLGERLD